VSADRPRTTLPDVLAQALLAVAGRRTRSLLTASGIALGVAATVATIGVSSSAAAAISHRFDAVTATLVTARYDDTGTRPDPAVVDRLRQVDGVVEAGLRCVGTADVRVEALSGDTAETTGERVRAYAAQPAALRTLRANLVRGRWFDDGHETRGDRVAMLDLVAARALGTIDLANEPVVFLDDTPYSVVGIYRSPPGEAQLTGAIVLPYRACRDGWSTFAETAVVARTTLGAADQVGAVAPLALAPEAPQAITMLVPADLRSFRRGVERDTQALFLGLAAVSLIIGALGVSNTTLVSVLERRSEIGLRRAVGASKLAVAGQFLVESGLLGLAGGIAGTVAGLDVITVVCLAKQWLVAFDHRLLLVGPLGGAAVGTLAGAYPALSAARIVPAASLRS
jgi:putative ABC transport system permease protein